MTPSLLHVYFIECDYCSVIRKRSTLRFYVQQCRAAGGIWPKAVQHFVKEYLSVFSTNRIVRGRQTLLGSDLGPSGVYFKRRNVQTRRLSRPILLKRQQDLAKRRLAFAKKRRNIFCPFWRI